MKNIVITVLGIAVNIFIYSYSQATERDLNLIVPKIYLFLILPLVLIIIILASAICSYYKRKNKAQILSNMLIAFFLSLIVMQSLLIFNSVLVK